MKAWPRALLIVALIVVGILGFVSLFLARHPERSHLAGPAAVVIASAAAGIVTLSATSTWAEQRQRDLAQTVQQQREQLYGEIAHLMVRQFQGGGGPEFGQLRSRLVTWASSDVVKALGNWNALVDELSEGGGSGAYAIPAERQPAVRETVSKVINALRSELHPKDLTTTDQIARAIFNLK